MRDEVTGIKSWTWACVEEIVVGLNKEKVGVWYESLFISENRRNGGNEKVTFAVVLSKNKNEKKKSTMPCV